MAKLIGFIPDYILRNYLNRGKLASITQGSTVRVFRVSWEAFSYDLTEGKQVTVTNLLPGFDEVYYPHTVHNAQVVWIEGGEYHCTDINNTLEVRNGSDPAS